MMEDSDGNPSTLGYNAVFPRRKDYQAAELIYSVEFSADMLEWTASSIGQQVVSGPDSAGELEVVSIPFPASVPLSQGGTAPPQFFRVMVEQN